MSREDFRPTKHSGICGDHFILLDYYPSSCMFRKTSVPSVFDFSQHLQKFVTELRQLKRKAPHIELETVKKKPSFKKIYQTFFIKSRYKRFY